MSPSTVGDRNRPATRGPARRRPRPWRQFRTPPVPPRAAGCVRRGRRSVWADGGVEDRHQHQDVITAPGISVAMPANAAPAISGLGSPPAMARAVFQHLLLQHRDRILPLPTAARRSRPRRSRGPSRPAPAGWVRGRATRRCRPAPDGPPAAPAVIARHSGSPGPGDSPEPPLRLRPAGPPPLRPHLPPLRPPPRSTARPGNSGSNAR